MAIARLRHEGLFPESLRHIMLPPFVFLTPKPQPKPRPRAVEPEVKDDAALREHSRRLLAEARARADHREHARRDYVERVSASFDRIPTTCVNPRTGVGRDHHLPGDAGRCLVCDEPAGPRLVAQAQHLEATA